MESLNASPLGAESGGTFVSGIACHAVKVKSDAKPEAMGSKIGE